jgi:DNA-binding transcriptional LysR family regulator
VTHSPPVHSGSRCRTTSRTPCSSPRLAEFTEAYPGIELELLTTHTVLNLSARAADIAVRLTTHPPQDLIAKRLSALGLGIYGHSELLAHAGREIRVILFLGDPDASWASRHFPDASVAMIADSAATVSAALSPQLGVTLLPCFYGNADPALRHLNLDIEKTAWSV